LPSTLSTLKSCAIVNALNPLGDQRSSQLPPSHTLPPPWLHQVFSASGGLVLAYMANMPLRRPPPLKAFVTQLAPVVAAFAGTLWTGNLVYLYCEWAGHASTSCLVAIVGAGLM